MTSKGQGPGCVLCRAVAEANEPGSLVLHLAALNVVVMNLYPYNGGHLMVAPRRHVATLAAATPEELGGDDGPRPEDGGRSSERSTGPTGSTWG